MSNKTVEHAVSEVVSEVKGYHAELDSRVRELEAAQARPRGSMEAGGLDTPEVKEFVGWVRSGGNGPAPRAKALDATTAANGAVTIPTALAAQIATVAAGYNPVGSLITTVQTGNGNFKVPVSTGLPAVAWVGDTDTRSATAAPSFALVTPSSGEVSAVAQISAFLLDDSAYDVQSWLVNEIGRAMGVGMATAFTTGDGTSKPKGFTTYTINASPAFGQVGYIPSGSASAITADSIFDLIYGVSAEYRAGGKASFLMSPGALASVRKLKATGSGDYLWQPGMNGGPSMLAGHPVYEAVDLPAVAGNAYPCWFGDWSRFYYGIDIAQPRIVLDPYTSKGFLTVYVGRRVGGAIVDSNAVKALKIATS